MSTAVAVITGGGTGIGRALAHNLADKLSVLVVGRREAPLQETVALAPDQIRAVVADVATPEGRQAVFDAVPAVAAVRYLVHNAAVLAPVDALINVNAEDWRHHMAVNVEGPLFLTQTLLPLLDKGSRVLHISSGAAHKAYEGWGPYCTSKAALNMLARCLDSELKPRGIRVGSAKPGVVDTPMQDQVRSAPAEVFPNLPRFQNLKESGQLLPPEKVAVFLRWYLMETDEDRFTLEDLDIRDTDFSN